MDIQIQRISSRLRDALAWRQVTASDLARHSKVSRAAVSKWLNGMPPAPAKLAQVAQYLNLSLNWLVLGIGTPGTLSGTDLDAAEEDLLRILRHLGGTTPASVIALLGSFSKRPTLSVEQIRALDLVKYSSMPIALLDEDGFLVYANEHFQAFTGKQEVSLYGLHFSRWIPHLFQGTFRTMLDRTLQRGCADNVRMELVCPQTGQLRHLVLNARTVRIRDGLGVQLLLKPLSHEH